MERFIDRCAILQQTPAKEEEEGRRGEEKADRSESMYSQQWHFRTV